MDLKPSDECQWPGGVRRLAGKGRNTRHREQSKNKTTDKAKIQKKTKREK